MLSLHLAHRACIIAVIGVLERFVVLVVRLDRGRGRACYAAKDPEGRETRNHDLEKRSVAGMKVLP